MTAALLLAGSARADEPEEGSTHGRLEDRELPGDTADDVADALAWLPREGLAYLIRAHVVVARFIHDRQLVPRLRRELGGARGAELYVFPTLFAETNRTLSVGARMVARGGPWGTSARVGFGGPRDAVGEGTAQVTPSIGDVGLAFSVEGLAESVTDRRFLGLGQEPEEDARNDFTGAPQIALYDERKARGLIAAGIRPHRWFQALLSTTITQRAVAPPDESGRSLDAVFTPDSVTRWESRTWLSYNELALRFDTRPVVGPPRPGVMAEAYAGIGAETQGQDIGLYRTGGRVGAFIPIYRVTNLLAPRLVLDTVGSTGPPLPFTELADQPAYRGDDNRRDHVSMVASLDYLWQFASIASARIFVDAAVVGPGLDELPLGATRVAGGAGLDLFSDRVDIGRFWIAGSADGVHLHLSIGQPSRFGDRQRRD